MGGIGVVVTLVYLAVQVRQNTAALKTASRQAIVAGMREHNLLNFQPGAQAYQRSMQDYPRVSEADRQYFSARMNDLLLFFQGVHALHEAGTLEDETYHAYLDFVSAMLTTPGGAAYWKQVSSIYTRRMVDELDARLARGGLLELGSLMNEPGPSERA